MLFIAILFFALLYLAVSVAVVVLTARWAKRHGRRPWRWGGLVALGMYLLVFWDHIPTVLMYKHYCGKEAGLTVYKTLEQWKAENPGAAEKLVARRANAIHSDGKTRFELNQRFDWVISTTKLPLFLYRRTELLVDQQTRETLAELRDFSTGIKNIELGSVTLRDYKIWLAYSTCMPEQPTGIGEQRMLSDKTRMANLVKAIVQMGEQK